MVSSSLSGSLIKQVLENPFMTVIALCIALLGYLLIGRGNNLPAINNYPGDWFRHRAYRDYRENAMGLVAAGLKKYNGPFQILTPIGPKVVLPAEYHDWVRTSQDVSHQAYVAHEFYSDVPGFEGNKMISNPDGVMIRLTSAKLSQNAASISIMSTALSEALRLHWTDATEWHTLAWFPSTQSLVSRMSAAVFAGPRLGLSDAWQKLTAQYVNNFFTGVFTLMTYPRSVARVVSLFLEATATCKSTLREMQALIEEELVRREAEGHEKEGKGDLFDWYAKDSRVRGNTEVDHAVMQAAFSVAALHTTSEALRQTLLDICAHSKLVEPLRKEIITALRAEGGLTHGALQKLVLLDSVMKESQRRASASVSLERRLLSSTNLPDGTHLRAGTTIGVAATNMWSTSLHTNPEDFDAFRHSKDKDVEGSQPSQGARHSFVASTKEHNTFGAGKFICPGRFFAANEIKVAVVHILLKYDIRLAEGEQADGFRNGYFFITKPDAKVQIRRKDIVENIPGVSLG